MKFPTAMLHKIRRYQLIIVPTLYLFFSCAYFNTFYNAEQYFIEAEKVRLENAGKSLPAKAIDSYNRVIEKCNKVLDKYPDSKYHDPALLLIGKARFHKKEYKTAEQIFKLLEQNGEPEFAREAQYWLALCKWKFGRIQPAIDDLNQILDDSIDKKEESAIYLSLADIYLEMKEDDQAFLSLEKAAEYSSNDSERGQIYFRMSHLAYERGNLERALNAYKNVMKYSLSKSQVEEANLKTVVIYREQGELEKASDRIKIMLVDDNFSAIHPELELELARLYQIQNEWQQALTRLASITETYPKSEAAADAYFMLAEYELHHRWQLDDALKYYINVKRESRKSENIPASDAKVKEITAYLETIEEIKKLESSLSIVEDSSMVDTSQVVEKTLSKNEIDIVMSQYLIELVELEAFHLSNTDSALVHLNTIITDYPNSDVHPRALFTLSYLENRKNNANRARELEYEILRLYPNSDYASFVREKNGIEEAYSGSAQKLREAESIRNTSRLDALPIYLEIVGNDSSSESSLIAGYYLADYYDYESIEPTKALYYYNWVSTNFPLSDQANIAMTREKFITSALTPVETDSTDNEEQ